ncbi:MAG: hypothetical protein IJ711_03990 [Lachnospiraceae bacterium]|nr:hypothetical protein [Lachnospiraceae bacterium]
MRLSMSGLLAGMMSVYYNLRTIFAVLFVVLQIITVVYGVRIRIYSLLAKKTGLHKKREIAMMEAGKATRKRKVKKVEAQQYTQQILMQKSTNRPDQTEKLQSTTVLEKSDAYSTTVLGQSGTEKEFCLLQNIVVVHGKPLQNG